MGSAANDALRIPLYEAPLKTETRLDVDHAQVRHGGVEGVDARTFVALLVFSWVCPPPPKSVSVLTRGFFFA